MTTHATTAAAVLLLTCFALDNVWPLRGSEAASSAAAVYDGGTRGRKAYADGPSDYDGDDGGGGGADYKDGDGDVDDGDNGRQQQEHEDQLDQDDPGKTVSH